MNTVTKEQEIIQRLDRIEKRLEGTNEKPLNFEEAAKYLDISKSHLYKLTSKGRIPHYKPEGKKLYFERSALDAWLLRNPVHSKEQVSQKASEYVLSGSIGGSRPYSRGRLSSPGKEQSR